MSDDPMSLFAAGTTDLGEIAVEGSLRPRTLAEYIGQAGVKPRGQGLQFDHGGVSTRD